MNPIICICCGEPIAEKGAASDANPNVCVYCTSLLDGMDLVALQKNEPLAPEELISKLQEKHPKAA